MGVLSSMFLIPNLLFFFFETTYGVDSITPSQSLTDGSTLVSKEGNFELGFFNPGSSKNCYLGIWYKNIPVKTVVWVANRDSPIDNVTPRTQSMSSTRDNGRTPISFAIRVCQASLTNYNTSTK